jgi:hypothetical protein
MQPEHANGWLKQLAAERDARRGGPSAAQRKEANPEPEQPPEQKRQKRVQPAKALVLETHESVCGNVKVIDLCESGESDCESVVILDDKTFDEGEGTRVDQKRASNSAAQVSNGPSRLQQEESNREQADSLALAQASCGLAMRLQQEESKYEQADSLALARLLQQRESAGEGPAHAHSPSHSGGVYSTGALPWPAEVTWHEQQHGTGPKNCGNFNLCDQGATYFVCKALNETTGHGVTPVPLPAQTIKIRRMDGVRVVTAHGQERKQRPGIDGKTTTVCVCVCV